MQALRPTCASTSTAMSWNISSSSCRLRSSCCAAAFPSWTSCSTCRRAAAAAAEPCQPAGPSPAGPSSRAPGSAAAHLHRLLPPLVLQHLLEHVVCLPGLHQHLQLLFVQVLPCSSQGERQQHPSRSARPHHAARSWPCRAAPSLWQQHGRRPLLCSAPVAVYTRLPSVVRSYSCIATRRLEKSSISACSCCFVAASTPVIIRSRALPGAQLGPCISCGGRRAGGRGLSVKGSPAARRDVGRCRRQRPSLRWVGSPTLRPTWRRMASMRAMLALASIACLLMEVLTACKGRRTSAVSRRAGASPRACQLQGEGLQRVPHLHALPVGSSGVALHDRLALLVQRRQLGLQRLYLLHSL